MKRLKDAVLKNITWIFGYRVIRLILAFFITAWIARYLGPEVYGKLVYGIAIAELMMLFWSQGLKEVVIKKIKQLELDDGLVSSAAFQLMLVGNLLLYGILALVLFAFEIPMLIKFIALICGLGILFRSFEAFELWFHSRLQVKYTVRVQLIAQILYMFVNVILIINSSNIIWFAVTYALQLFCAGIGFLIVFRKHIKPVFFSSFTSIQKRIIKTGGFMILAKLIFTCSLLIDRFIIESMLDLSSLGIYSASMKMVSIWTFISSAISLSFISVLTATEENERYYFLAKKMFGYTTSISICLVILFAPFSDFLVQIVFGELYQGGGKVFQILIFGLPFIFLNDGIKAWLVIKNQTLLYLMSMFLTTLLSVVLNIILIDKVGIIGSSFAFILSWFLGGMLFFSFFKETKDLSRELFLSFLYPITLFKKFIIR